MRFILFTLLAASLLVGCAATPSRPPSAPDARNGFALEARFVLRTSNPGQAPHSASGRLSWTHRNGTGLLLLSSPLGYGLAEIASTPGHAVLRLGNGETRESADPDALMQDITGQRLPVSRLPAWLLGQTDDQSKLKRDILGRPQHLEESGWQITYAYDSEAADALPSRLTLNYNNDSEIELRLRIEEWKDKP